MHRGCYDDWRDGALEGEFGCLLQPGGRRKEPNRAAPFFYGWSQNADGTHEFFWRLEHEQGDGADWLELDKIAPRRGVRMAAANIVPVAWPATTPDGGGGGGAAGAGAVRTGAQGGAAGGGEAMSRGLCLNPRTGTTESAAFFTITVRGDFQGRCGADAAARGEQPGPAPG